MALVEILILALLQGITEFLPISSSGHLILVPVLTGWPDQGLVMDVAVHMGTLGAVIIYFRHDVWRMTRAFVGLMRPGRDISETDRRLLLTIILATIPVVITGLIFVRLGISPMLRSAEVIAWASIIFGILLYWVDTRQPEARQIESLTWRDAIWIGLAQVLALIPGTSRSGITMTAGRKLGFTRRHAARFSMLLSIPTIAAAGLLASFDLARSPIPTAWTDAAIGAAFSFLAAIGAIHFLMRWLAHANMTIFVIYRIGLGIGLLAWAWF